MTNGITYDTPGNALKSFSKHTWWGTSSKTRWMLLLLVAACVSVQVGAAEFQMPDEENIDAPILPMVFYGNVMINGELAPDGITILAKIDDEERGSAVVKDGMYGESSYNRLIVRIKPEDEGKPIHLYIESTPSNEMVILQSGEVKQLDLTFDITGPAIQPVETPEIVTAGNGERFETGGEGNQKSDPLGIPGFAVTLAFCCLMIWLIIRKIKDY